MSRAAITATLALALLPWLPPTAVAQTYVEPEVHGSWPSRPRRSVTCSAGRPSRSATSVATA